MSTPVKIGLALVILAVLIVIVLIIGVSGTAMLVLLIGILAVLALLGLYFGFMKWRKKRKADPFERELAGSAGAVPSNISDASGRARLDDLRQKFMKGIDTFKSHGKDIYSLPWYAIVGEPGSGKTEALRHSNIGFPPGLQDELQGSGGTINMDWWFTNHAIILDTAGRLMFDEAATSANPEWVEFLKLLRRHRPNCPINGLVLVIPADSIIRDSADQIQEKGGRIARQLDLIQRTLGVRFPVFILITKADLVNGFREFFDQLTDPQLQHQILGWSNPGHLDDPFDPEDVVEHIYTVQERLERRRLGLLLDPISREGAMGRRLDEVDALFAFPESMANIAPRLRRYLELIFVSGEWSSKPLFLRGIYFVSSMREGSALDADLAEAFGLPVEQLPEGRIWERDRSYFLRDLFLMKMFRERGLVTRTSNTAGLKRRRGGLLVGTSIALAVLLLGATWWQSYTLGNSIGAPEAFWSGAAEVFAGDFDPAGQEYPFVVGGRDDRQSPTDLLYLGAVRLPDDFGGENDDVVTVADATHALGDQATREIGVPIIFKPVGWFSTYSASNLFEEQRLEAARTVFEFSVLRPLITRALNSLGDPRPGGGWPEGATEALIELLRIYALMDPQAPHAETISLRPLFAYVLRPEAAAVGAEPPLQTASPDIDRLQEAFERLRGGTWPGGVLASGSDDGSARLGVAIDRYIASIGAQWEGQGRDALADAISLLDALDKYDASESGLLVAYAPPEGTPPRNDLEPWTTEYARLGLDGRLATAPYQVMSARLQSVGDMTFSEWYNSTVQEARQMATGRFRAMLETLPAAPAEGDSTLAAAAAAASTALANDAHRALLEFRTRLETRQQAMNEQLGAMTSSTARLDELEQRLLRKRPGDQEREFQRRAEMYRRIEEMRSAQRRADDLSQLAMTLESLRGMFADERARIGGLRPTNSRDEANRYYDAASHVLDLVAGTVQAKLTDDSARTLAAPRAVQEVARLVEKLVQDSEALEPTPAPRLAMTKWRGGTALLNPQFHHRAALMCLGMLLEVEASLRDRQARPADADALRDATQNYLGEYIAYWGSVIATENPFEDYQGDWRRFYNDLILMEAIGLNDDLVTLAEWRESALKDLRGLAGFEAWPRRIRGPFDAAVADVAADMEAFVSGRTDLDRKCDRWVQYWSREMSGNIENDRKRVLATHLADFRGRALGLYPASESEHAVDYWERLTAIAVGCLARASEGIIVRAQQTLDEFNQFPLKRLDPNAKLDQLGANNLVERQLTREQVQQARQALNDIRPGIIVGAAEQTVTYQAGTLGHPDSPLGIAGLTDDLQGMRGKDLTAVEAARYERLASLFRAFPADLAGNPLQCQITYLYTRAPTGGRGTIDAGLPYLTLTRENSGLPVRKYNLRNPRLDLGMEPYPGSSRMVFEFSVDQSAPPATAFTVNGPWAVLALLHKFNGTRSVESPDTWTVEVVVPDGAGASSMWLELKFDNRIPLPKIEDWPQ